MKYSVQWVIELYAAGKIGRESSNRWLTLHYQRIYANTWTSAARMLFRRIRKTIRNVVRRRIATVCGPKTKPQWVSATTNYTVTTNHTTTYGNNCPQGTLITRLIVPNK